MGSANFHPQLETAEEEFPDQECIDPSVHRVGTERIGKKKRRKKNLVAEGSS